MTKQNGKRNPHSVFYGSSYDRGLEHLLRMWPDIIKEIPDAELHCCYGWNLFDSFYSNNPERMAWREKMNKMMEYKGVVHHGRVGHPELENIMSTCSIWAYPSHFGEISCITAMRAQMLGCIPVATDYAALGETVQHGVKIHTPTGEEIYDPEKQEEFRVALVKALKDTKWQEKIRPEMMTWAREKFTWENVAKQWSNEFTSNHVLDASKRLLEKHPELEKYLPYDIQESEGLDVTY